MPIVRLQPRSAGAMIVFPEGPFREELADTVVNLSDRSDDIRGEALMQLFGALP